MSAPSSGSAAAAELARAQNRLGVLLYQDLRDRDGNLAISPTSVSLALSMTLAGARGETAEAMARALQLEDVGDPHAAYASRLAEINDPARTAYELRTANRLFGEQSVGFREPFIMLTGERYGAPLEPVDFRGDADGARVHINDWIAGQTNDRIQNLLPSGAVSATTQLVLTNAIYFKGKWEQEFEESQTRPRSFQVMGTRSTEVPTMHQHGTFAYADVGGVSLVELPYRGGELSMVIVLPAAVDGLAELEQTVDAARLETWIGALEETEVDLALPRFKIDPPASISLSRPLQELGMGIAFGPGADFSGISDAPLFISEVFHKPFIEVNEEGTEAAAATAVVMDEGARINPSFEALHPFLFLIRDRRDGSFLFLGRVVDPR